MNRDELLLQATENFVRARDTLTAREVIEAVTRARVFVRDGFAVSALELPPSDEYVMLVIGMAGRDLDGDR